MKKKSGHEKIQTKHGKKKKKRKKKSTVNATNLSLLLRNSHILLYFKHGFIKSISACINSEHTK